MLWSLTKVLIFISMVAALAFGAVALLDTDGGIRVQFGGVEFTLSLLMTTIAFALLVLGVWVFLKVFGLIIALLRFINGDETAFSRYFDRSREQSGVTALADSLVALARGDGQTAITKAKKADRLLNRPEVTQLIIGQAAENAGDSVTALETYKTLLNYNKTRFVGLQGLLKQKLGTGDTETALKLAQKAIETDPTHGDTQDILLTLQTQAGDWADARDTLGLQLKHGRLPRDVHRRRDSVMALADAQIEHRIGNTEAAHVLAGEANRLSPGLVPAAVLTAQGYMEQNKPKLAERVLKEAWKQTPHPELAKAFASVETDENATNRIKRFTALTRNTKDHPETKMTMAELHLASDDYTAADTVLGGLDTDDPTMRSLTIRAAIEQGQGAGQDVVRRLLSNSISAPRDCEWICDNC
ncbi:MAG: heme biosynthesis HemY N-terminal domain-containing protein, partial [Pseudomonadota bacterium]